MCRAHPHQSGNVADLGCPKFCRTGLLLGLVERLGVAVALEELALLVGAAALLVLRDGLSALRSLVTAAAGVGHSCPLHGAVRTATSPFSRLHAQTDLQTNEGDYH